MKMLLVLCSTALIGCSHLIPEAPKTVLLPYAPELLREIQQAASRSPASIDSEAQEQKSPRRVYFSALYHQYLTLGQHLNLKPDLTYCPQFHHDRVETEGFMIPTMAMFKKSSIEKEGREFFPELVFDRNFSLADVHASTKQELSLLCEEGVSDNYYKFDNLVTHYADKKSFHLSPEAMVSVLKIPVFSNFYLLKMFQGHKTAFHLVHPEERKVIELSKTHWFEDYVEQASLKRDHFIKARMVQR